MTLNMPDTRRLVPATDPQGNPADVSLYERLGGCYGIAGAVDVLVDRLFQNPGVNANEKVHEHHGNPANAAGYKFLVTAWSIEAVGGPKCYIGHDMSTAHEHLNIDTDGFEAVYREIESTLVDLGAPAPEINEFMSIIESFRSDVVA
jgi:hemoglobin